MGMDWGDAAETGGAFAVNPWLGVAKLGLDFLGGGLGGGEDRAEARREREQRWREQLMQMAQRQSEQMDQRGITAGRLSSVQAMQPLADRAFTGLQARFGQGPAVFGETGAQNRHMQNVTANYRPGQNSSMQQYGADLEMLKRRFMERPTLAGITPRQGTRRIPEPMEYR